jgi:hypothetical protein
MVDQWPTYIVECGNKFLVEPFVKAAVSGLDTQVSCQNAEN